MINQLIQPDLLRKSILEMETKVFLCGPGYGQPGYDVRETVRSALHSVRNVSSTFGEEIDPKMLRSKNRVDLLTLESRFAHSVDFTILILESAGAIAELGTFSMIQNLRSRLFVLVPVRFYDAKSFIARGPLSLISKDNLNNVIYFEDSLKEEMESKIKCIISFFKYLRYKIKFVDYDKIQDPLSDLYSRVDGYDNLTSKHREEFSAAGLLAAIMMMDRPSFPQLVLATGLPPSDVSRSLKSLYGLSKIRKGRDLRYEPIVEIADPTLEFINKAQLSKARAKRFAAVGID